MLHEGRGLLWASGEKTDGSFGVAIVGAGPGGLCMAIGLLQSGFEDFIVLERADGLGGTWFHNRYPGCACDVPSHLYSFSFEPKLDWSRPYAPQPEILAYMDHCAEKYGVRPHCRFGDGVRAAQWDEDRALWRLELDSGETIEAEVVVSAIGMFNELAWPDIPGREEFKGTSCHTARWNWDHPLSGETVGVIGSAASAVQAVPEIAKEAARVYVFQRTPNWVMPKEDDPLSDEQLAFLAANPDAARGLRDAIYRGVDEGMTFSDPAALSEMEASVLEALEVVKDPETRRKLTPDHPLGSKRPLFSNEYFAAFNRPNVELVTERIERITEDSVVTADGASRRVDTLIYATGFCATKFLLAIDVRGRGGVRIDEAWSDGACAYLGITTAGFPNLFMLYGPNTNNGSILSMIESQVDYAVRMIRRIESENLAWMDIRPEPMARYNEEVQRAIAGIEVWNTDCNGYYRTPSGRIVTQWPYSMSEFRKRTLEADDDAYEVAAR